jgi:hypothetical protein
VMAGTISLGPDKRWSAAGWLFDWTVEFLAENVGRSDLREQLEEIVTENLGWLGLGDYGSAAEREMRELLRNRLVGTANEVFAPGMEGREPAIGRLQQLAGEA